MVNTETKPTRPDNLPTSSARRLLVLLGQVGFLIVVWLAADYCGHKLGVRIPASVLGMLGVLLLLGWGRIEPKHIQQGAQLLLAEMLLFFIPAFVGLVKYSGLLGLQGIRLMATIALGTIIVMAGTVWVVDWVFQWENRRNGARRPQA